MKLRRLRPWILLAAVLMGQWLAVVHSSEHALQLSDVSCAYCVSGVGPAPLPAAVAPALNLALSHHAPLLPVVAEVIRPVLGPHGIRGPPLLVC